MNVHHTQSDPLRQDERVFRRVTRGVFTLADAGASSHAHTR